MNDELNEALHESVDDFGHDRDETEGKDLDDNLLSQTDGDQDGNAESQKGTRKSRKRKKMHCFNCNRQDGHYLSNSDRWFYNYLLGMSFGLMRFVGPFSCQCCGSKRLMFSDYANLRYLFRDSGKSPKSSKSRSKSKSKSKLKSKINSGGGG